MKILSIQRLKTIRERKVHKGHGWVLGALVLMAFQTLGAPPVYSVTVEKVLTQVQKTYAHMEDLQADFTQETSFEGFSTKHQLTGVLYLKKPSKMRWDYQAPSKQQIFLLENEFTYYIPEHHQVVISSLSQKTAQEIPIHLLATLSTLGQDYTITWEKEPSEKPEAFWLRLHPKQTRETSHVIVEVNPRNHYIEQISVTSINGNQSNFSFANIKVNKGLKDSLFAFEIPKGVEVVQPPTLQGKP